MVNRQRHKLTLSKAPSELTIEDLHDGCSHRGYCNKMFLAVLTLHVAQMPPTKFWLNLTYHWEQMRFFKMTTLGDHLSQTSDQNDFSNSESLCRSNASHQVWVHSTLRLERCRLNLKIQGCRSGAHLVCQNETNLTVLNLSVFPMPLTKF